MLDPIAVTPNPKVVEQRKGIRKRKRCTSSKDREGEEE
jgi:hypothetical protein